MEMGLSMASLFDPCYQTADDELPVYITIIWYCFCSDLGMHRYLLKALAETYELIPINGAVFHDDALLQALITFMGDYIIVGFRICLPIFAVMIILNAVLGILAKVSPQLNMFAVGIQMKVLVGFCVLFVTTAMLPDAAGFIYEQMKRMVVSFVRVMSA